MPENNAADKETWKELYTEKQRAEDEKNFGRDYYAGFINSETAKRLIFNDICWNSRLIETGYIGTYSIETIRDILKHPRSNWRKILALSDELMRVSPYYYRLNSMFGNMSVFCWGIDLYGVKENARIDTLKTKYTNLALKLETMNLKHEFSKIMRVLPYQDVFFGLLAESKDGFFIQRINPYVCKPVQIQDGIYNFAIDFLAIKPSDIGAYPEYVQEDYLAFINGDRATALKEYWYIPDPDKQICVKLNSQWVYPFPLLIGIIDDILNLDIYKKLKLQSARTDNYKAILVKVPVDKDTIDKPLLTPDLLAVYAELNRQSMSDDIGIIHVPSDGTPISFENNSTSNTNVNTAGDDVYNSAGVTHELFNGSSSATAVTYSVENNSAIIYSVYRQLERWMNRFIRLRRYDSSSYRFGFYLLDATIFNREKVTSRYKDACSLGATVVDKWLASIDMTPSRVLGSFILHKDIYDYVNNFTPLRSTYNSPDAVSGTAGRPTNEENGEGLSDEGEKTADGDRNRDR